MLSQFVNNNCMLILSHDLQTVNFYWARLFCETNHKRPFFYQLPDFLGLLWDTVEGQSHQSPSPPMLIITVYLFEFTFNSKVISNFKERIKNQFQHKKCFETLTLQFSLNNSKITFFSYKIFQLESFLKVKPQLMKVNCWVCVQSFTVP